MKKITAFFLSSLLTFPAQSSNEVTFKTKCNKLAWHSHTMETIMVITGKGSTIEVFSASLLGPPMPFEISSISKTRQNGQVTNEIHGINENEDGNIYVRYTETGDLATLELSGITNDGMLIRSINETYIDCIGTGI
ncbi:hypothetical protein [Vibrio barjaei]|uniref:hypothetical protein n=1 Tax=Vibrio barjaei TaxID=1676683 RepID=UPI002285303F|nr:hypothetical protein [Vibrio barjaei]MCY9872970.1 hypothetical protein [Vibrio barjaei]